MIFDIFKKKEKIKNTHSKEPGKKIPWHMRNGEDLKMNY